MAASRSSQKLSVEWYGPDGWLVAYDVRDALKSRLSVPAPVHAFEEPGPYRAVLRSGAQTLAEGSVMLRDGA